MRALLDTNILIHREAATVVRENIGTLFFWLDRLKYEKCVHPLSLAEIEKHKDVRVRKSFRAKLQSYHVLKTVAPVATEVLQLSARDVTDNDKNDTLLVNELRAGRIDLIISEDRGVHAKAATLVIGDRVFTIDSFLEKVTAENPDLVDYKVLSVRRIHFGEVDLKSTFFDSFREDYGGGAFDRWFNRKADEPAYVCYEGSDLVAFLYLKLEGKDESYHDIAPVFSPRRRLKIGTFKVELNGYRLGERFLKIVFDNAIKQTADEVYVTIFPRRIDQQRLVLLLEEFGFRYHGKKSNPYGEEEVYVRDVTPRFDGGDPKLTFPYVSRSSRAFLVPIYPQYHTDLLPDSILRTESPADFVEQEPHRNAIRKVYVGRSYFRDLHKGDTIVFYRTGGYYKSVLTTLGIVDGVYKQIKDEEQFIRLCRKRSVFSDNELREQWNYRKTDRPFITGFLYAYSFPKRPNMKELIDNGLSATSTPRLGGSSKLPRNNSRPSSRSLKPTRVLLSIKPKYSDAIFRGDKRFEFRRAIFRQPVQTALVYTTSPVSRVVGEFDVKSIITDSVESLWRRTRHSAGIDRKRFFGYFAGRETGHAIVIGSVRRYPKSVDPTEEFGIRPPQSFAYVRGGSR
jgi:predicted transcriptional regulator